MIALTLLAASLLSTPQLETPSENDIRIGAVNIETTPEQARTKRDNSTGSERVFTAVEKPASFPGGDAALHSWIGKNLRYPEDALDNNTQGIVVVKFIVEKDGSISSPVVEKGADKELDKEAIRVVRKMPKWKPAFSNGTAVRSYYVLPVSFKLN